jgi:two-component system, chemotaxis family, response regulator Rcp1
MQSHLVLLVEDSAGDARLMQEAFRACNGAIRLHIATDGVEAMAFLRQEGQHADALRPDLILLDLNMPRMHGLQVLAEVKEDDLLKSIPVVVLTTSEAEADIAASYELQVNCYLIKPAELDEFEGLVNGINDFWMKKVRLPPQKRKPDLPRTSASETVEADAGASPARAHAPRA